MSADNGIYILSTPSPNGREFRVREMQSIENVEWDESHSRYTTSPEVMIKNARMMWYGCQVFTNKRDALVFADGLAATTDILEYGISTITIEREF